MSDTPLIRIDSQPGTRLIVLVSGAFVATLLISNISAQKLIAVGPFVFTGGIWLFPFTYIFGDCLTEVYGFARARQVIWVGLGANLLMALFLQLVLSMPAAPGWNNQESLSMAFGQVPRIVLASTAAYFLGELANSYTLAKMKVWSNGKRLWARTIGSTGVGEGIDSIVFVLIAFTGIVPTSVMVQTMWSAYLFKVLYEIAATPLTYAVVGFLKRVEGVDIFDRNTNFTPFRWRA